MMEFPATRVAGKETEDGMRSHRCLEAQGKMGSGRLMLGIVAAALFAVALFGGVPAGYAIPDDASSPRAPSPYSELSVPGLEMNRALEQLSDSVIEWDQGKAIDQGIRGILSGVGDPYASLITKSPKSPKGGVSQADLRVRGRSWPHSAPLHCTIPSSSLIPSYPTFSSSPPLFFSTPLPSFNFFPFPPMMIFLPSPFLTPSRE